MNPIVERIEKLKGELASKKQTGRTSRMLDEVIEMALEATQKSNFVVFALDNNIARYIMEEAVRRIPSHISFAVRKGQYIELNNVLIAFKSEEFRESPSFKYQTWDMIFTDNSIFDDTAERTIQMYKNELEF